MLYDLWRCVLQANRNATAVFETATGRRWSFADLDRAALQQPRSETLACPTGHSVEFILTLLRAWYDHTPVCPLEPGQTAPHIQGSPDDCVHFKITSASSGAPRTVACTAPQLLADVENIRTTMGLRPEWPNLAAISLAHSYGFSNLVLPLLAQGIPLVLAASPLPGCIQQTARSFTNLTIPAVPALWRAWCDAGTIPPSTRLAISAGAPLPLPLEIEVFERHQLKIHNFYGASECGGIAYDASLEPRTSPACVGHLLHGVQATLDPSHCLEIRSLAVGSTYWPNPSPELAGGRFLSSDLAELRDGQVHLLGRASERINVAGRKVDPETIEQRLRLHPSVRNCLVLGVPAPGSERHETIVAVVELATPCSSETLRTHLLQHLAAWQVPRDFRFVPSLTPNHRGKLSRAEWRERCTQP
jgi:acyl-CoA synthetase (AMP-forming)/AMP-acid ligase II